MKILYHVSQLPHQRVFEKLQPISGVDQIIVGPREVDDGIDNYGYKDFGIQNIVIHKDKDDISSVIKNFEPDIYVNSVLSFFKKPYIMSALKPGCKLAYIHHGFCAKTSVDVYNLHKSVYNRKWMENARRFSVACGGIKYFCDWMGALGLSKNKITLNCVPQLDLLYDQNYYNSRKNIVMGNENKESILFFGRVGVGGEFEATNEEFFNTLIELHKIVTKNDMVLFVKPKSSYKGMIEILKKNMKSFYKRNRIVIDGVLSDKRVRFIKTSRHIYQYYFADFIVLNGSTSSELESVIALKPTITINTIKNKFVDDIYNLSNLGAVVRVEDLRELEKAMLFSVSDAGRKKLLVGRDAVMNAYGLSFDGLAHKRTQDAIIGVLGG